MVEKINKVGLIPRKKKRKKIIDKNFNSLCWIGISK